MSTKNNPKASDCYARALPDEPMFVLLARDPAALSTIEFWVKRRQELGVGGGEAPGYEADKQHKALALGYRMACWRYDNLDRVKQEAGKLVNREETAELLQAEVTKLQGIIAERRKIQLSQGTLIDAQQEKIAKLEQEKEKLLEGIRLNELAATTRINQLLEANTALVEARRKALDHPTDTELDSVARLLSSLDSGSSVLTHYRGLALYALTRFQDMRRGTAPSAAATMKPTIVNEEAFLRESDRVHRVISSAGIALKGALAKSMPHADTPTKSKKEAKIRIEGMPFDRTPPNDKPLFWYRGKIIGKNYIRCLQESLEVDVPHSVVLENRWALYRGHSGFEKLIDKGTEEQLISFCYQADKLIDEYCEIF